VEAGFARRKAQVAVLEDHAGVGRNDVYVIRLDAHAVPNGDDRNGRPLGQYFRQQAFMLGIEMLDQDKGHSGIRRQGREQLAKGFEPASRSTDAHHRERIPAGWAHVEVRHGYLAHVELILRQFGRPEGAIRSERHLISFSAGP